MSVAEAALDKQALDLTERKFRQRIIGALAIGAALLLVLVGVAGWLYGKNREANAWVEHTYSAQARISGLATLTERLETARRGYLLTPRPNYWRNYVETRASIRPGLDQLGEFTSDNPRQTRNVAELGRLFDAKFEHLRLTIELAHDGDVEDARRNFLALQEQRVTERLRERLAQMMAEEERLLDSRQGEADRNSRALLVAVVIVALLLAGLSGATVVLMRRFADDLGRSQSALRKLNAELEGRVRERTAELARSNEEIQRFAYIVSHDLRSPLVNVMGFTSELEESLGALRRQLADADSARPGTVLPATREAIEQDIPECISFIRSSTKKMDRLINAILQLSRQGRRALTPEPLDMHALAQGVADSVVKLAQQKASEVVVEPIPMVTSDRVAVEQVLSNLVENAVKYAQPGRAGRVVVRGRESGGRVLVEVEDNGRGIAPQDHERVFELFRRSGPQDTPGEGIGLAHVRALVYRLGGTIACISELGQGATFRVSLPAKLEVDRGHAA